MFAIAGFLCGSRHSHGSYVAGCGWQTDDPWVKNPKKMSSINPFSGILIRCVLHRSLFFISSNCYRPFSCIWRPLISDDILLWPFSMSFLFRWTVIFFYFFFCSLFCIFFALLFLSFCYLLFLFFSLLFYYLLLFSFFFFNSVLFVSPHFCCLLSLLFSFGQTHPVISIILFVFILFFSLQFSNLSMWNSVILFIHL